MTEDPTDTLDPFAEVDCFGCGRTFEVWASETGGEPILFDPETKDSEPGGILCPSCYAEIWLEPRGEGNWKVYQLYTLSDSPPRLAVPPANAEPQARPGRLIRLLLRPLAWLLLRLIDLGLKWSKGLKGAIK